MKKSPTLLIISLAFVSTLRAELKLPAIISDHMVLQQKQSNPIWGWAVGFAICGEDKVWHPAKGKILRKDKVEVTGEAVAQPIAVRYAWADNPVCNLASNDGLPVTPFRTDDFEMTTKPKPAPAAKAP